MFRKISLAVLVLVGMGAGLAYEAHAVSCTTTCFPNGSGGYICTQNCF